MAGADGAPPPGRAIAKPPRAKIIYNAITRVSLYMSRCAICILKVLEKGGEWWEGRRASHTRIAEKKKKIPSIHEARMTRRPK